MVLSTEFTTIVSLFSGIAAIIAFVKMITTPLDKIKDHDKEIKELKEANKKQSEIDKAMLNGLQAITNHMIDGNGVDKLKASRDELARTINDIATK